MTPGASWLAQDNSSSSNNTHQDDHLEALLRNRTAHTTGASSAAVAPAAASLKSHRSWLTQVSGRIRLFDVSASRCQAAIRHHTVTSSLGSSIFIIVLWNCGFIINTGRLHFSCTLHSISKALRSPRTEEGDGETPQTPQSPIHEVRPREM